MKKSDKISAALAAGMALLFVLVSAFYNRIYTAVGGIATAALWLLIAGEILLALVYFGRVLYSIQDETRFRGGLFLPPAAAVLCMVFAFLMLSPIESYQNKQYVSHNLESLTQAAQRLQQECTHEEQVVLHGEDAKLSVNGKAYIYICEGDKVCVLFPTLDHAQRLEGYLYLPEKTLYSELTSRFSGYSFEEIGERLVRICLYK